MADHKQILDAVIETTQYMLNSVSEEGAWGVSDYSDWGPIITALIVEHLLLCGVPIDKEWTVINNSNTYQCSLKKCMNYLAGKIHDDGSFGADFWDTCKFAALIKEKHLEEYFEYEKVHSYIIQFVKGGGLRVQGDDYSQSAEWSGPGTYAACAHYLLRAGERDLADKVLSDAIAMQQSDGSFVGKKTRTGDNLIHPIWHTSQMLKTMLEFGSYDEGRVKRIEDWIISVQCPDGQYDHFGQFITYYTAYAVLAYLALPKSPAPHTDLAIEYILKKSQNGKYDDFGGTIMAAQAFDAYLSEKVLKNVYQTIQISQANVLLLENNQLKDQTKALEEQVRAYDEKYKDADIILSKKDAWKLSVIFGTVTLILGLIVPVLINAAVAMITKKSEDSTSKERTSYVQQIDSSESESEFEVKTEEPNNAPES